MVLSECKTEKRNSQLNGANKRFVLHKRLGCGSLSITTPTPVSLLASGFDVRSELHGQLNLAADNQMCVIHEVINGYRKTKDLFKDCFESVNIQKYPIQLQCIKLSPILYSHIHYRI